MKRSSSRVASYKQAQRRLDKTTTQRNQQQTELAQLSQRLIRFERDNAANGEPIEAEFRLDAGFGTYTNVALLIEMGYDLYTKPHSHTVVTALKRRVEAPTSRARQGATAVVDAWPTLQVTDRPLPLRLAP